MLIWLLKGQLLDPIIYLDARIEAPAFDKIHANNLKSKVIYAKDEVKFSDFILETDLGVYSGQISLPVSINLKDFMIKPIYDRDIDLSLTGISSSLEFLIPYTDNIRDVDGKITWQLEVNGPFINPIKTGQISFEKVSLDLINLDNKVHDLTGVGKLNNNYLWFNNITASMHDQRAESNLLSKISNLSDKIFDIKNNDKNL